MTALVQFYRCAAADERMATLTPDECRLWLSLWTAAKRLPHVPCEVANDDHSKCCTATSAPDPCGPCALGLALAVLDAPEADDD